MPIDPSNSPLNRSSSGPPDGHLGGPHQAAESTANAAEPRLPAELSRDLAALFSRQVEIPPDLDAEVRAAARAKFEAVRKPALAVRVRRIGVGLAAAASLAIVAWVAWPTSRSSSGPAIAGNMGRERGLAERGEADESGGRAAKLMQAPVTQSPASGRAMESRTAAGGRSPGAGEAGLAFGTGGPAVAKGDVNADARIDILDALALAMMLRDGADAGAPDLVARADVTSDGRVDQADVDAIARAAVAIASTSGKGGGS